MLYVGHLSAPKGLPDAIRSIRILLEAGHAAHLTVLGGKPRDDTFPRLVEDLQLEDHVTFLTERVPHNEVVDLMHEHDLVLVPSRHDYPEGLPLTIYDAFCSRSPLVASDHPMFRGKVVDGVNAVVFRGGDARSLAESVMRLMSNPVLYERLSRDSRKAWQKLQCPVKWEDLILKWLRDTPEDRTWLAARTLASDAYDQANVSPAV
jgi:glycosyltransferase involved in cell wall biosynthesis